jgi:hypothetical protein
MPRKPSGQIGAVRAQGSGPSINVSWNKILFPDGKEDHEALVARAFLPAAEKLMGTKLSANKLPEADHDFHVEGADIDADLQLMEMVIRPNRGSPYDRRKGPLNPGKYSDLLIGQIRRKQYPKGRTPIWLLLYYTHWQFDPSAAVQFLLHRYLTRNNHPYEKVFLLHLFDQETAEVNALYPDVAGAQAEAIGAYTNEQTARAANYLLADPNTARAVAGGVAISFGSDEPSK